MVDTIGQLVAVAWSDNHVRLFSPESNKLIHEINACSTKQNGSITCLGWGSNVTFHAQLDSPRKSLHMILNSTAERHDADAVKDLPRDLALLDIEGALPKLSLLPAGKEYVLLLMLFGLASCSTDSS